MSSDVVLKVNNVGKRYEIYEAPHHRLFQTLFRGRKQFYKEFWALKDISFEVKRGECVGIIGRNGSGKSTLLQIIAGTLAPTTGEVEVNGRVSALLELGSGFNPEFTGRENVCMNGAILGLSKTQIDAKFDEIASFADIGEFIDQPVKIYSSGMYVRLAFAVAIHADFDILIVDEALAVGDAGFQLKCMLRMKELQEQGITILFVSHDTGSVIRLCDSALVLEQGKIIPSDKDPLKCVKMYEQITRKTTMPAAKPQSDNMVSCTYQNELQGISETRFGSQEAEYLNVQFIGDDGKERNVFRAGEEIEIRTLIRSSRIFTKVASGFTLKNRAGVDVWGDNTVFADFDLSLTAGFTSLSYRFKLNIIAGEYFLYIGLADISDKRYELDQRWPIRRLTIVSSRLSLGFVYAPAQISIQQV